MAEFCLDCWNRINNTNDPPEKYIFSDELDLCEGCAEWKRVIVTERRGSIGNYFDGLKALLYAKIYSFLIRRRK